MDAKQPNELIIRLKAEMKRRKVKPPAFEKQTGLPKDRVYKWFKNNPKINTDDAKIIEDWINGNMENVPRETASRLDGKNDDPLEQAILNLSETDKINAKNIERLINILEAKFLGKMELPERGTPGHINLQDERIKKASR